MQVREHRIVFPANRLTGVQREDHKSAATFRATRLRHSQTGKIAAGPADSRWSLFSLNPIADDVRQSLPICAVYSVFEFHGVVWSGGSVCPFSCGER